jgi:antitoxin component of MazEF toxin-antitoxin module
VVTYGVIVHTATLRSLGGSIAVTIPGPLVKALGLDAGARVSFTAEGNGLMLVPVGKYSLDDVLAMQGSKPLIKDQQWDAMPAAGQEVSL